MGLELSSKHDSYTYKDKFNQIEFVTGKPVYNLPPDVERYLLGLGYFFYRADPGKEIPEEIQKAEENAADKADTPAKKEEKYKQMRMQAEELKKKKAEPKKTLILDDDGVHEEEELGKTDIDFDGVGFDSARQAFEILGVEGKDAIRLANNALNLSRILKCAMPEACTMIINKEGLSAPSGKKVSPPDASPVEEAKEETLDVAKEEPEEEMKLIRKPAPTTPKRVKRKKKVGRK